MLFATCNHQGEEDVHSVMDTWALDFVTNRLPPFPFDRSHFHIADPAFADGQYRIVHKGDFVAADGTVLTKEADAAEAPMFRRPLRLRAAHLLRMRETEDSVVLHHPFDNSRREHMGSRSPAGQDDASSDVVFSGEAQESAAAAALNDFVAADDSGMGADLSENGATSGAAGNDSANEADVSAPSLDGSDPVTDQQSAAESAKADTGKDSAEKEPSGDDDDIDFTVVMSDDDDDDDDDDNDDDAFGLNDSADEMEAIPGQIELPHEANFFVLSLLEQGREFQQFSSVSETILEVGAAFARSRRLLTDVYSVHCMSSVGCRYW